MAPVTVKLKRESFVWTDAEGEERGRKDRLNFFFKERFERKRELMIA